MKAPVNHLMKAAYIESPGPPENILYGDLPRPEPAASQVLVKVSAVAVNPVDTYIRSGMYALDLQVPFVVGCDLAGEVVALGPEAARFKIGDRVWGTNQGLLGRQGTFSEYAAVDECWLYPTPDGVEDRQVAAVALVGITAHLGTFRDAGLKMGDTLFVNGGTGGVGSCVVQMAKAIGARVMATAGSDEKVQACREMGAAVAVNYKTQSVEAALRDFAPEGVDIWWETLREHDLDRVVDHLAVGGRAILMAGHDSRPPLPVGPFYEINRWLAKGKLRPKIDRVMPLSEAAAAHRLQEENTLHGAGTLAGKLVLTVGNGD